MDLPFDGAISAYFENDAPNDIRNAVKISVTSSALSSAYPGSASPKSGASVV